MLLSENIEPNYSDVLISVSLQWWLSFLNISLPINLIMYYHLLNFAIYIFVGLGEPNFMNLFMNLLLKEHDEKEGERCSTFLCKL